MTLQSPRPLHALDLPEILHRISTFLPHSCRSDLLSCMLVSRRWYLSFAGSVWNTIGSKEVALLCKMRSYPTRTPMLLTKYGQYILNAEIKSEADFKILQHQGVKNLECLTVSLPLAESEGLMRELISDLVKRCRKTLRTINLQGPPQGAGNLLYHFDINTFVPNMTSRLEEVHIHNVTITREGFSNFLRGTGPNLRHLRLNNVCIATYNSAVELFTESDLTHLVCSIGQVMNPGKGQTLGDSVQSVPSLLIHFPALQHWTVEADSNSSETFNTNLRTQLHQQVVQHTSHLRSIQINDANSYFLTELLARVFLKIETCSLQFSHFTSDAFLGLLQHHSTLTTIHIQTRTMISNDSRNESMRSMHLVPRTCAKLEVLSVKGYEIKIEELDEGEWACKGSLRELRVGIIGFKRSSSDVCLRQLQAFRSERVLRQANWEEYISAAVVEVGGGGSVTQRILRRLLPLDKLKTVCLGGKDFYLATR
ncbi:hypothetical protein BGZ96_011833 [Linnemannia gamsii]|uniref:F-box domain-containing protein n=1 Tax=Linnemannia gamsii TaxID=64522 RepID=A0ABQ7JRW0_9FUNG|nr:hypothetical protein BGZ96_011833 [Linnemannia gamsii]